MQDISPIFMALAEHLDELYLAGDRAAVKELSHRITDALLTNTPRRHLLDIAFDDETGLCNDGMPARWSHYLQLARYDKEDANRYRFASRFLQRRKNDELAPIIKRGNEMTREACANASANVQAARRLRQTHAEVPANRKAV